MRPQFLRLRARSLRLPTAALVVCIVAAGSAFAGNVDPHYLSSDAAMQAGAITADSNSGGSIWYNPAGLSRLPSVRLDVSINALSLRLGAHPDLGAGSPETQRTRLSNLDLNVVPAGLTWTRRFGSIGAGFGVFVPNQQTTLLRTRVVDPSVSGELATDLGVDTYETVHDYFAGPSFGVTLDPTVDFGASLLVHYRSQLAVGAVDLGLTPSDNGNLSATIHESEDSKQVGVQPVLGVQLHPRRDWNLGFTFRLPSLRFYQFRQTVTVSTTGATGGSVTHASEFTERSSFSSAVISPARFHTGVSHGGPTGRVAIDVNYQAPFHSDELNVDLAPTINVRLGGRVRVQPDLVLGGGLFSDRSPRKNAQSFGESDIDYYGVTAAVDWSSPYEVSGRDGQRVAPPARLVFGTTLALTYAAGFGDIVNAEVAGDLTKGTLIEETPARVVVHVVSLHVGSTLTE